MHFYPILVIIGVTVLLMTAAMNTQQIFASKIGGGENEGVDEEAREHADKAKEEVGITEGGRAIPLKPIDPPLLGGHCEWTISIPCGG